MRRFVLLVLFSVGGLFTGKFVFSSTPTVVQENAIFLDVFEVKVKKNDPGLIWEPKIFLSSQAIPFEVSDGPEAWNGAWFEKMKNEPKE